jgi:acetoin utilization transport system ATP-binding protein
MSEYQIECISLSKHYTSKNQTVIALDDVSMGFNKNDTVLIKGRSGAGKSTLLNLMCGFIKPTNGKVFIDKYCINELSDVSLSKLLVSKIGIIFQNFNLLPAYTVYENIEIALVPKMLDAIEIKKKIMSLLTQFNMWNKAQLLPSELSVGQQQKVGIIRTLAKEPSIIFADEPTGSVDDQTASEILEYLANLKKEKQVTLVIATHGNIPDKFADKIFILNNGRLAN